MQISVTGQKLDVGDALKEHVEAELNDNVKKFFENAISANVVFSKSRHLYKTDIVVNEGADHHFIIKSSAEEDEIYTSFDRACEKLSTQLRRYKKKLTNHHKTKIEKQIGADFTEATKYILSGKEGDEDKAEDHGAPLIIAEKTTKIERLTVSEAVMIMDLGNLPALMFINRKNENINIIYKREDGNISWVDSGLKQAAS